MKRDMDLVRDLLLAIEDSLPHRQGPITVEDVDQQIIDEHLRSLNEGGLIEVRGMTEFEAGNLRIRGPYRLTWKGHDFLDTVRDPEVWRKTKQAVGKVGGTAALETWKAGATAAATAAVTAAITALRGGA